MYGKKSRRFGRRLSRRFRLRRSRRLRSYHGSRGGIRL